MLYLCQFGYGVLLGLLVSVPLTWRLGFGQVRHSLRIIGTTSILLASAYIFRSKGIIRFGNCQKWIWFNASFNSRGFQTELLVFLVTTYISSRQLNYRFDHLSC